MVLGANQCSALNVLRGTEICFLDQKKKRIVDPLCSSSIALSPPQPPQDQQNADLGWIDKIVDCQPGVDLH